MLAIYIDAGHSTSGNPRRGWIIADDQGNFISFVDEGYEGRSALDRGGYRNLAATPRIEVKPSVYRDAYRQSYSGVERAMKRENKLHRKLR
jgi:hypothetical protein